MGAVRLCLVSLLLLSSLPAGIYGAEPDQIVMSREQWTILRNEWNEQQMTLTTLKAKLNLLKQNSTEQEQTLLMLQEQLTNLQDRLQKTSSSLTSANASLTKAENELTESKASLMTLKNKIQELEHDRDLARRQRDTWAIAAGVFAAAGLLIAGR